ncbi:uncharacterized protein LOC126838502 [Adelges cooleyi]|uniref:uncharacterized protein LOC126838502 n=1 Tax=Adelges cooleyi TaxID=133065 RepID=UPI00218033AF|nr:uncharacterized protein LOC126838502 [Adelges cooleyi]
MDEITDEIDRVVNVLNVLKSRYFLLRAKYDVELNSKIIYPTKDIHSEYQYASKDLQSFIMLELHLLDYACTYGLYSMNMYATRSRTNLIENEKDPHFLKLLKEKLRSIIETNHEIQDISVDSYLVFSTYVNSFLVRANILRGIQFSDTPSINMAQTNSERKKKKLLKKISKINLMANIIQFIVADNIMDYRTEEGQIALNISLKYRTPRSLEYYTNKVNSKQVS